MEYQSAVKKEDMLSFAMAWVERKHIVQSEINQTQKDRLRVFSLTRGT
jgi:hypothetical protein